MVINEVIDESVVDATAEFVNFRLLMGSLIGSGKA